MWLKTNTGTMYNLAHVWRVGVEAEFADERSDNQDEFRVVLDVQGRTDGITVARRTTEEAAEAVVEQIREGIETGRPFVNLISLTPEQHAAWLKRAIRPKPESVDDSSTGA